MITVKRERERERERAVVRLMGVEFRDSNYLNPSSMFPLSASHLPLVSQIV